MLPEIPTSPIHPPMNNRTFLLSLLLPLGPMLLDAHAASSAWSGGASNEIWTDAANWGSGVHGAASNTAATNDMAIESGEFPLTKSRDRIL